MREWGRAELAGPEVGQGRAGTGQVKWRPLNLVGGCYWGSGGLDYQRNCRVSVCVCEREREIQRRKLVLLT